MPRKRQSDLPARADPQQLNSPNKNLMATRCNDLPTELWEKIVDFVVDFTAIDEAVFEHGDGRFHCDDDETNQFILQLAALRRVNTLFSHVMRRQRVYRGIWKRMKEVNEISRVTEITYLTAAFGEKWTEECWMIFYDTGLKEPNESGDAVNDLLRLLMLPEPVHFREIYVSGIAPGEYAGLLAERLKEYIGKNPSSRIYCETLSLNGSISGEESNIAADIMRHGYAIRANRTAAVSAADFRPQVCEECRRIEISFQEPLQDYDICEDCASDSDDSDSSSDNSDDNDSSSDSSDDSYSSSDSSDGSDSFIDSAILE